MIHKGGHKSKKKLNHYRPIALMNAVGKILCAIDKWRLKEYVESNGILGGEQNGFRAGRRGTDNIFILGEVINCTRREGSGVCIAFLDIEKVYNRVDRDILWGALENIGVCGNLIDIIKSMYRGTRAKFILGDISTDWVGSSKGVRQGYTLSPLLFSI